MRRHHGGAAHRRPRLELEAAHPPAQLDDRPQPCRHHPFPRGHRQRRLFRRRRIEIEFVPRRTGGESGGHRPGRQRASARAARHRARSERGIPGQAPRHRRTRLRMRRVLAALLFVPFTALSQSYPTKPIRWIVPYTGGGITDVVTRVVAQKMQGPLGQSIVVDNRPGANSILGSDLAAKAAPDGYTMVTVIAGYAANVTLYQGKLPFDPRRAATAPRPPTHLTTPTQPPRGAPDTTQRPQSTTAARHTPAPPPARPPPPTHPDTRQGRGTA